MEETKFREKWEGQRETKSLSVVNKHFFDVLNSFGKGGGRPR